MKGHYQRLVVFVIVAMCSALAAVERAHPQIREAPSIKGVFVGAGEAGSCIYATASDTNMARVGFRVITSYSCYARKTFNGDDTGREDYDCVGISHLTTGVAFAWSSRGSYGFAYTLLPDGAFHLSKGPQKGVMLSGPRAGQSFSITASTAKFVLSADRQTIQGATDVPTVETITYSNGDVFQRICHEGWGGVRVKE